MARRGHGGQAHPDGGGYTSGRPGSIGHQDGDSLAVKPFCHVKSSDRHRPLCGGCDAGKPAAQPFWTD
ncbi:MAG: hypothetical protein QOJ06_2042 [Pseudonocardiales bacterium]|jgi:hypothetical protein|nr:hypothetical protein [Pseudonocardiales bacterium]